MAHRTTHTETTHQIELTDDEYKKLRNIVLTWKREKYDHMPTDYYDELAFELFRTFEVGE